MSNDVKWDSNFTFLMAMIGSAVGLGNIWRFPYIFYKYGQGTFLIAYLVAILVLGFPFLLIEYSVGYKFKDSLINILSSINEKFKIFVWLILLIIFFIATYYVCIVGWDLIYIFLSFFKGWGANPNTFFANDLLQSSTSLNGLFYIVPVIFISVITVWFVIWFISHKNLNDGVGKISRLLVPLLFVITVIIVVFSLTLPGASIGYMRFLQPDWNLLMNLDIWLVAFGQIIFSLSLGMAIVLTYASYLPDKVDLTKNAITVITANCGFELFNAVGVFSILGFMCLTSGIPFNDLITEGTGLAFIVFPDVFNQMGSGALIIGPLFFIVIFIAGITSAIALVEPLSLSISDQFGFSRKKSVTLLCILGLLVSTLFATGLGSTLISIFDFYLNSIALMFVLIVECIIFTHFIDCNELMDVLNDISFIHIGKWWSIIVKYILPIILFVLWINGVINYFSFIMIIFSVFLIILALILYYFSNNKGGLILK